MVDLRHIQGINGYGNDRWQVIASDRKSAYLVRSITPIRLYLATYFIQDGLDYLPSVHDAKQTYLLFLQT